MLEDVLNLLDRQRVFLQARSGVGFFFGIPAYLSALRGEPRVAIHLADLREQANDLGIRHRDRMGETDGALEYAADVVGNAGPFRSGDHVSATRSVSLGTSEIRSLYAHFRQPALVALDPADRNDYSRTAAILRALDEQLMLLEAQGKLAGPLATARQLVNDELAKQVARHQRFVAGAATSAGVALARLEALERIVHGERPDEQLLRPIDPSLQVTIADERSVTDTLLRTLFPTTGEQHDDIHPYIAQSPSSSCTTSTCCTSICCVA